MREHGFDYVDGFYHASLKELFKKGKRAEIFRAHYVILTQREFFTVTNVFDQVFTATRLPTLTLAKTVRIHILPKTFWSWRWLVIIIHANWFQNSSVKERN